MRRCALNSNTVETQNKGLLRRFLKNGSNRCESYVGNVIFRVSLWLKLAYKEYLQACLLAFTSDYCYSNTVLDLLSLDFDQNRRLFEYGLCSIFHALISLGQTKEF